MWPSDWQGANREVVAVRRRRAFLAAQRGLSVGVGDGIEWIMAQPRLVRAALPVALVFGAACLGDDAGESGSTPDGGQLDADQTVATVDGGSTDVSIASTGPAPYLLELEVASTGAVVVSHNALLALTFDLSQRTRRVSTLGPEVLAKVQTLGFCTNEKQQEDTAIAGIAPNLAGARLGRKDVVTLEWFSVEMAFETTPPDGFTRRPGSFCFGWRGVDGAWRWRLAPNEPRFDEAKRTARGVVGFQVADVDGLAILFDTTTVVRSIALGIHRPGEPAPPLPEDPCGALCAARAAHWNSCGAQIGNPLETEPACRARYGSEEACRAALTMNGNGGLTPCDLSACRAFCEARQDHIRRCGARALIRETLEECLATSVHPSLCPTDPTRGGWLGPCPGEVDGGR
jgi:hypothetical protein